MLLWRERFAARGVPGLLKDAPRPGRHKAISPEVVKRVVDATLHTTPRAPRIGRPVRWLRRKVCRT